jgi:transposase
LLNEICDSSASFLAGELVMEISISAAMPDDRNCQVIERLEARPLRGRRGWSAEAKARLVEATLVPGANVSAIARGAGMAPSQLFGWRRQALAKSAAVTPVAETGSRQSMRFTRIETVCGGTVEIAIGDVVLRAGSDVDAEHLARVIRAVRQA